MYIFIYCGKIASLYLANLSVVLYNLCNAYNNSAYDLLTPYIGMTLMDADNYGAVLNAAGLPVEGMGGYGLQEEDSEDSDEEEEEYEEEGSEAGAVGELHEV